MSAAAREVELKFLCAPEDLERALAAAPSGPDKTRRLVSTYFDTAKGDLRKAGVSLRVREADGERTQTVKRGGGLEREEHEAPVEADAPDLSIGPLRELVSDDAHKALAPAFRVDVTRRERLVSYADAEIELAADLGEIRNGRLAASICELELELKQGEPAALFDLARSLSAISPLYLSFEAKAAQGQAMLDGAALAPRKKGELRLSPEATAGETLQAMARDCTAQIAGNAAVLRQVDEPEVVHQLRVGARRLRSALATFRPILGDDDGAALGEGLKWLAKACDQARNLDVQYADTVRPALERPEAPRGLDRFDEAVQTARAKAYGEVLAMVSSQRFRDLVLELAAWIETGAWRGEPGAARPGRAFAADALERRRRKLLKRGRGLETVDDDQRHKARLQAKRLRYTVEAFAPLFDAKAVERFLDRLRPLQDHLGTLNDIATAEAVVEGLNLDPAAAYAAGRLIGERAAGRARLIRRAVRGMRRLEKVAPFWRE